MILLSMGLAAILLVRTITLRKSALADLRQIKWIEEQYSNALRHLQSGDRGDLLNGLQIIGAFNEPQAQLRVLPEVRKLIDHEDPRVARHARNVLDRIITDILSQHSAAPLETKSESTATPAGLIAGADK